MPLDPLHLNRNDRDPGHKKYATAHRQQQARTNQRRILFVEIGNLHGACGRRWRRHKATDHQPAEHEDDEKDEATPGAQQLVLGIQDILSGELYFFRL